MLRIGRELECQAIQSRGLLLQNTATAKNADAQISSTSHLPYFAAPVRTSPIYRGLRETSRPTCG